MESFEEIELGTVVYDEVTEEGRIEFLEGSDVWPRVIQLDVLHDLTHQLEDKYNEVHKLCYPKKDGD